MDIKGKEKTPWAYALEIFSDVSSWIVGPVVLALIVGKYLDGYFGTKPWIFLGLTGIAFLISTYGIVKVVSEYIKKTIQEDKKEKDGK
jgi:F0F1-type ATP synthase assembly protein I